MKHYLLFFPILFFFFGKNNFSIEKNNPLESCPSSPNCVSTFAKKKRKKLPPLKLNIQVREDKAAMKKIIAAFPRTKLIEERDDYLHFEFVTKLGKFTDDVEFYFDEKDRLIHFRSASQKGWSDMGANKRRMKKISKKWNGRLDF